MRFPSPFTHFINTEMCDSQQEKFFNNESMKELKICVDKFTDLMAKYTGEHKINENESLNDYEQGIDNYKRHVELKFKIMHEMTIMGIKNHIESCAINNPNYDISIKFLNEVLEYHTNCIELIDNPKSNHNNDIMLSSHDIAKDDDIPFTINI